jgi:hypothetical protein
MTRLKAAVALCCAVLGGLAPTIGLCADNPPGLMHSTLLNGVKLDHKRGELYLYHIQAVFLPPAESKTIYKYNPNDGGKIWAMLSDKGGAEVARFDFYGELLKAPFWLLNSYKLADLRTGEKPASGRVKIPAGEYVLDFFLESGKFYTFPFTVSVLKSGDAFAPEDYHFLDGAWEDWGYLFYADANPDRPIQWKVWLRNKQHEQAKDVKIRIEVSRGGQLVATSRENMTFSLRPEWVRYEFDLIRPMKGTSGGAQLMAKDLLAQDGAYTLTLAIDGQPYGTWHFTVQGGKPNYTGRTVRGEADPLTFVEGARDAWWYERQK